MGFGYGQRCGRRLPADVTTFVGRADELAQVRRAFGQARLVTRVGPGGVGKSRTALRAAAALGEQFPDGIWPGWSGAAERRAAIRSTPSAVVATGLRRVVQERRAGWLPSSVGQPPAVP
ncbi:hypothetical protein [Streptomyces sp. NPDC055134]